MFGKKSIWLGVAGGILVLGLSIVFAFWMTELNAKKSIQYITVKNEYVYVLRTSLYESEDGAYTKHKLIILNENHNKVREIPLIKNIKRTIPFEKSTLFFNTDDWNRVKEYMRVEYATFQTQIINQEKLETSLFPQGIKDIFYVNNLLKVTDKSGYTHYLHPETLKNYGTAHDEYTLRKQNPELNMLKNEQETVSEAYITQEGYTLYQIQNDNSNTHRKKVCRKNNTVQEQKITVGFFTEKEIEEEKKEKKAEAEANCTKTDFLDVQFIGASLKNNAILAVSFKTTDHKDAIIHCLDKNLKIVWEKDNISLHIGIKSVKNIAVAVSERYIFLTSENTVIVLGKENGNLIKKVKI